MSKRILLASQDVSPWGGAATVNYLLFEKLQRDGFDIACVNLVGIANVELLQSLYGTSLGNPRNLPNVHTLVLPEPFWQPHTSLQKLIEELQPDLLMGFGFVASGLLLRADPVRPLIFKTVGSLQLKRLLIAGAIDDFIHYRQQVERGVVFRPHEKDPEYEAARHAFLIFTHSPLVRFAFESAFPHSVGKIYENDLSVADLVIDEVSPYRHLARPFAQRDVDLLFIANNWDRPEKNYKLVKQITAELPGLRIEIVGRTTTAAPHAHHHDVITDRTALFELLGRTKVVASPSLQDAAPAVLFEAAVMGCNVVTSPNCGNSHLCHPDLVAQRCERDAFVKCIERALVREYPHHTEQFLGGYDELRETLRVL